MLFALGSPDPGLLVGGYLGAILLGALLLAFGLFCSSLTRDQIVAFVLAALFGFLFVLSGHPRVVEVLDGLHPGLEAGSLLRSSLSALPRFEAMAGGVLAFGDLAYFIAWTLFFLWLNLATLRSGAEFGT